MSTEYQTGVPVGHVATPALLLDLDALERNIARMAELASGAGIAYRPHAKSHKSPVIARMQLAAGAAGVCCAKLGEAEVMAAAGIGDILITSPVIGAGKIERLVQTARRAAIAVVADDAGNIDDLARAAQDANVGRDVVIEVVIEVDVGQGRCGVAPGPAAAELAERIAAAPGLRFRGLQGYQGLIQMTPDFAARRDASLDALDRLLETAEQVRGRGIEVAVLTGGGTGTSVIDAARGGLTEIQPGGYIFMDSRYGGIEWDDGNPTPFEKSLTLRATVISRPAANRAILDMGYKAVSSDGGLPVPIDAPGATFGFAGEEHGELTYEGACPLEIGDAVAFWPSHCDTTVNLYDRYVCIRGGIVEAVWEIAARGRVQ